MKTCFVYLVVFTAFLSSCNNMEKKRYSAYGDDIESMVKQSDEYYQSDQYAKAILLFDKIVALDSTKGEIYFRRGYCRALLSEYVGSSADYFKSIELGFRVEDSYFSLGCNYAITNNDTLALKFFMKAYEMNPQNQKAKIEVDRLKRILGIEKH